MAIRNDQPPASAGPQQYAAFISYRHRSPDQELAQWLVKAIERYVVPGSIRKKYGLQKRLGAVFRDEEELPASSSLGDELIKRLNGSGRLIVISSPQFRKSRWCRAEVRHFCRSGRQNQMMAAVVDGEPSDAGNPRDPFVARLRWRYDPQTRRRVSYEPIAADFRPQAGRGRRRQWEVGKLKLIAGIIGCGFDDLYRRDRRRRSHVRLVWAAALLPVLFAVSWLAVGARSDRSLRRRSEQVIQARDLAAASLDGKGRISVENRLALAVRAHDLRQAAWRDGPLESDALPAVYAALRSALSGDATPVSLPISAPFTACSAACSPCDDLLLLAGGEFRVEDAGPNPSPERFAGVAGRWIALRLGPVPSVVADVRMPNGAVQCFFSGDGARFGILGTDLTMSVYDSRHPTAGPLAQKRFADCSPFDTFSLNLDGSRIGIARREGPVLSSLVDAEAPISSIGKLKTGGDSITPPIIAWDRASPTRLAAALPGTEELLLWDDAGPNAEAKSLSCQGLKLAGLCFDHSDGRLLGITKRLQVIQWTGAQRTFTMRSAKPRVAESVGPLSSIRLGKTPEDLTVLETGFNDAWVHHPLQESAPQRLPLQGEGDLVTSGALPVGGGAVTAGAETRLWLLHSGLSREPEYRPPGDADPMNRVRTSGQIDKLQDKIAHDALKTLNLVGVSGQLAVCKKDAALFAIPSAGGMRNIYRWNLADDRTDRPQVLAFRSYMSTTASKIGGMSALAVSRDDRYAAVSLDALIELHSAAAFDGPFVTLSAHDAPVSAILFRPSDERHAGLVSLSTDGVAYVWDVAKGAAPSNRRLDVGGPISALACSPDGPDLAVGMTSGAVVRTDAANPASHALLTTHPAAVACVRFSEDGMLVASADVKGDLRVTAATGEARFNTPLPLRPSSLLFSPDKKWLMVGLPLPASVPGGGAPGGNLLIYDVTGQAPSAPVQTASDVGGVYGLCPAPDPRYVFVGCGTGQIRCMLAWPDDCVAEARKYAPAPLSEAQTQSLLLRARSIR